MPGWLTACNLYITAQAVDIRRSAGCSRVCDRLFAHAAVDGRRACRGDERRVGCVLRGCHRPSHGGGGGGLVGERVRPRQKVSNGAVVMTLASPVL